MPPKKRSKPESSFSSIIASHYEDYLLFKPLVKKYRELCKLKILPTRYIKFDQLAMYDTHTILHNVGLARLLDEERKVPYYPFLVYLFYDNLSVSSSLMVFIPLVHLLKIFKFLFLPTNLRGF